MKHIEIKNYRQIKVKFLPPTYVKGARIKFTEPQRFNDRKSVSVTIPVKYGPEEPNQQALDYLTSIGLGNVVARCHDVEHTTYLVDNWGEDYVELR